MGNPKVMYGGMMNARKVIVQTGAQMLGKCSLIGLRYSNLRKQFKNSENVEIPVI